MVDHPDAAMKSCLEERPDLILMDVWMPGRSGIQACRVFREHPVTAELPILLMSGSWRDDVQLWRAIEVGATDVLAAPTQLSSPPREDHHRAWRASSASMAERRRSRARWARWRHVVSLMPNSAPASAWLSPST